MTDAQKRMIDEMSRLEMARLWRFAPAGDPIFQGEIGEYFQKVFAEKGGFSPAISKGLEWHP